jgi:GTPase involved in cell partitioning and DNA repair
MMVCPLMTLSDIGLIGGPVTGHRVTLSRRNATSPKSSHPFSGHHPREGASAAGALSL